MMSPSEEMCKAAEIAMMENTSYAHGKDPSIRSFSIAERFPILYNDILR